MCYKRCYMLDLREEFKNWLIAQGYKEKTESGLPSTVYDYIQTLDRLCCQELHIDFEALACSIFSILPNYQGKTKTALHKYNAFLFETDFTCTFKQQRKNNILGFLSKIPELNKDFYTTQEAAEIIHMDERTMKRWRENRIGKNCVNRKKEYFNNKKPIGPKFIKVGGRYYYKKEDLLEYLGIS